MLLVIRCIGLTINHGSATNSSFAVMSEITIDQLKMRQEYSYIAATRGASSGANSNEQIGILPRIPHHVDGATGTRS